MNTSNLPAIPSSDQTQPRLLRPSTFNANHVVRVGRGRPCWNRHLGRARNSIVLAAWYESCFRECARESERLCGSFFHEAFSERIACEKHGNSKGLRYYFFRVLRRPQVDSNHSSFSFNPLPVLRWSSSIFFAASALDRFSSISSPASSLNVLR